MHIYISAKAISFLRVASIGIAAYDYLLTVPAEWRFYASQRRPRRFTLSCCLFALIRYLSIALVVVSNVGWFSTFSVETCRQWYLVPPIFKVLQAMVSQLILGVRTYNLSRRSRHIAWTLLVLYCTAFTAESITSLYKKHPVLDANGMCHAMDPSPEFGAWLFYIVAIVYDFIVTIISLWYLLKYSFFATTSVFSNIAKMMLYDGMMYFMLLAALNIFNVILYRTSEQQLTAAASLSYVFTWIMSQRLLIHLHQAAIKHLADNSVAVVTMTKSAGSALDIGPTPHSRLDGTKDHRWTIPDLDATSAVERGEPVGMRVQIERTVRVEDPSEVEIDVPRSHEHPTSTWTSHGTWSTTGDTSDMRATWDPQERWMMTTR